jgi:hypothetical protein
LPVVPIGRSFASLLRRANHAYSFARLVPERGALRGRHERWTRDAVDALVRQTIARKADGEVVWS